MNALFSRLEGRERRTLERLAAATLLAAALFLALAVRQRTRFFEDRDSFALLQESVSKTERSEAETKAEWLRWREAASDLESFRGRYFYVEKSLFESLHKDLQQFFGRAGVDFPAINFRYSDLEKVPLKKILLTFSYSDSYADLKRFLGLVERFPKFLAVEKLEFQKTETDSGLLNLRLTLAAYYEN
jgi:Tfp pilus assembly protein PilO